MCQFAWDLPAEGVVVMLVMLVAATLGAEATRGEGPDAGDAKKYVCTN